MNRQRNVFQLVQALPATPQQDRLSRPHRSQGIRFGQDGRFELLAEQRQLLVDGVPAPLRARALDVLILLVERSGELVSRSELLDRVWAGLAVEENNLSVQINALRKVLGAELVATVPGRGYRFTAPLGETTQSVDKLAAPGLQLRTHLPEQLPSLIGRASELAELAALVDGHRLVSVLGPGGVGKTRLAQTLMQARSQSYRHGVCWVELATLGMPELNADAHSAQPPRQQELALAISAALGLGQAEADDVLAGLLRALEPLELLIALDNAEHLCAEVAAIAAAIARVCPGVKLLITSQAPLQLPHEQRFRLGGLSLPPEAGSQALSLDAEQALSYGAVALFMARAQAKDSRFALNSGNVMEVIDLCRRLNGSALAIELAASRLQLLGLHGLMTALSEPLRLLNRGSAEAPSRQQALRAALGWSHGLLSPAEQAVFRRLAVFVGSASLSLVQEVLMAAGGEAPADEWALLDALGGLVDRSLVDVLPESSTGDVNSEPRYRLLDHPLTLARELLLAHGELPSLQASLAWAAQALCQRAYEDLLSGRLGEAAFMDRLAPDIANLQGAVRWAQEQGEQALALSLAPVLSLALGKSRHAERTLLWTSLEPWLEAAQTQGPTQVLALLYSAEHWQASRPQHGRARAQQALQLAQAQARPDQRLMLMALRIMASCSWRLGERPPLQAAAQACADIMQKVATQMGTLMPATQALGSQAWSPYVRSAAAAVQAWLCGFDRDFDGALRAWEQHAQLCRDAGISDASAINNIAGTHLVAGRSAEAVSTARALAERLAGTRDRWQLCQALGNCSAGLLSQDDAQAARPVLQDWWPLARQFDMQPQWADDAALVAALEGRPKAALRLIAYADAAFAALGQPREGVDQARVDRAEQLARASLSESQVAELKAEGAALTEAELPRLGLEGAA